MHVSYMLHYVAFIVVYMMCFVFHTTYHISLVLVLYIYICRCVRVLLIYIYTLLDIACCIMA